jgi:hypothetical protein
LVGRDIGARRSARHRGCFRVNLQHRSVGRQRDDHTRADWSHVHPFFDYEQSVAALQVSNDPLAAQSGYFSVSPAHVRIVDLNLAAALAPDIKRFGEPKYTAVRQSDG